MDGCGLGRVYDHTNHQIRILKHGGGYLADGCFMDEGSHVDAIFKRPSLLQSLDRPPQGIYKLIMDTTLNQDPDQKDNKVR